MLNPETFTCERCGECCTKYTVKLSNADIKVIKKLGYDEAEFTEIDNNLLGPNKFVLKKDDDYKCVFLRKNKNGVLNCKIYENRPLVCRKYPFLEKKVETCKPVSLMR